MFLREERKLAARADVHERRVEPTLPRAEEAGLIVAERGKDAQPAAAQFCLLRDFRQEPFRQSRPADGLPVKARSVKQAEAGGHGGREARGRPAGQPHGEIVRDRADGSGPVRDGSGCLMAGERDEAVAGGEGIAGPRSQAGRRAFPVRPRLRARLVLPGVERREQLPRRVHIDDAVHLAGQADAADVRKFLQQPVQQGQGCVLDAAGILLALPRLPGDGSAARYGARAQEPAVRVQHGGGDRRRPEIKAQMIHIDPSSIFQWE